MAAVSAPVKEAQTFSFGAFTTGADGIQDE